MQGESLTPAIGFEQATGRDIDAPTRWEEAADEFNRLVGDEESYPYRHLDPEFRSRMPFGERAAWTLRESVREIGDLGRTLGPAAGEAVLDAATVGITGDPSDPETQRQEMMEEIRDFDVAEAGQNLLDTTGLSDQAEIQGLMSIPRGLEEAAQRRHFDQLAYTGETAYDQPYVSPYSWEGIKQLGQRINPFQGISGEDWKEAPGEVLDIWRDEVMGPVVKKGMEYLSPETFLPDPTKSVREADLETEAGRARTGGGGTQFMPTGQTPEIPVTNVGGLNIGALTADYKKRAEEISVSAEEDEATAMSEIASLITKTQDDARGGAFDAFMMEFGAGVAAGDIPGGIQRGTQAIGDIKKEARDAVRSLDATRLSRYFEGSKAEMDRLVAMASMDASFANALVTLMVEQGRAGRADKILIGSVFAAMLDDSMGTYQDVPVTDILRTATRAVTGGNSDISGDLTYNLLTEELGTP